MKTLIFLIANQARALFYSKPIGQNSVQLITSISNESGTKRRHDLVTEHTNVTYAGLDGYPHPTDKENQPKLHELEMFARQCVTKLHELLQSTTETGIVIICAPKVLGIIRPQLSDIVNDRVIYEIAKDIIRDEESYVANFSLGKALA